MFDTAVIAARYRKRIGEIAAILIRYGADDLARRLGLSALLKGAASERDNTTNDLTAPERLRLTIEALGPVFIKLGQILSTRADLLSPEWTEELEKLQSHVTPAPWEELKTQVEADLGAAPADVFATFDPIPLAAGSIAQVYCARLKTGEDVIVKVRRPNLRPQVEADLKLLSHLAGLIENENPDVARFRPKDILRHLSEAMHEELDLTAEGRNCEAIAENLKDQPDIEIPPIYWDYSGETLLVQGFVNGITPTDAKAISDAGLSGPTLAQRGAEAFLHMALIDGLFHADPHPGNLRALPDNRVGFIDFGMVGRLGANRREQILTLLSAMISGNADGLNTVLLDWSNDQTDLRALEAAAEAYVVKLKTGPLQLAQAVTDFMTLARTHELVMPSDLALLFKGLITADGVMHRLDPNFDIIKASAPLVTQTLRQRFGLKALNGQAQNAAFDLYGLARETPSALRLLIHRLRQGKIHAAVELQGIEHIGRHIERAATRLGVAIIAAAFALGLAPSLLNTGPELFGFRVTGLLAVMVIIGGLIWLLRPRKDD
ncbi:ABC1 kinase family protein [Asticcacaulis tiandongensis]|uniref:ABC1 kinase family protein n=1 Tax=Asticcacaulis tiandongensis TaxID=2565365 RepID=UPI00112650EF|nr:AarF/UbiB family protein [Asticcacaulis tiandongensis]